MKTSGAGGERQRETGTVATEREGRSPHREVGPGLGRALTKSVAKLKELRGFLKGLRG